MNSNIPKVVQQWRNALGSYNPTIGIVATQYLGKTDNKYLFRVSIDARVTQVTNTGVSEFLNAAHVLSGIEEILGVSRHSFTANQLTYGHFRYCDIMDPVYWGYDPSILLLNQEFLYLGRIYNEQGTFGSYSCEVLKVGNFGIDFYFDVVMNT